MSQWPESSQHLTRADVDKAYKRLRAQLMAEQEKTRAAKDTNEELQKELDRLQALADDMTSIRPQMVLSNAADGVRFGPDKDRRDKLCHTATVRQIADSISAKQAAKHPKAQRKFFKLKLSHLSRSSIFFWSLSTFISTVS